MAQPAAFWQDDNGSVVMFEEVAATHVYRDLIRDNWVVLAELKGGHGTRLDLGSRANAQAFKEAHAAFLNAAASG